MNIQQLLQASIEHHKAGRPADAEAGYRQILAMDPRHADAWHLLGVLLSQAHRHDEAIQYIVKSIELKPTEARAYNNLGRVFRGAGFLDDARRSFEQALLLKPDYFEAIDNLGRILHEQGSRDDAIVCFRRALQLKPQASETLINLGILLLQAGRAAEVLELTSRLTDDELRNAGILNIAGSALRERGEPEKASEYLQRAVQIQPDHADAWSNLGAALQDAGRPEEAIVACQKAIALRPESAEAHSNLGSSQRSCGRWAAALTSLRESIRLNPGLAQSHHNLAVVLEELGEFEEAAAACRRAIDIDPACADAHCQLGQMLLRQEEWQEGWQGYEWRWQLRNMRKFRDACQSMGKPCWNGEPLSGKTLLVLAEQGLGDTFQFIRYLSIVREYGARVLFSCPKAAWTLLKISLPVDDLLCDIEEPPQCDFFIPLLSLPRVLQTDGLTIPRNVPYIQADDRLILKWRERLSHCARRFRIAINWQGRGGKGPWQKRDLPLSLFEQLASLDDVQLICIQKYGSDATTSALLEKFGILDFSGELDLAAGPFMDTAAIMKNCDLVITSDTSVAHLAGALAVPVWVPLPGISDWRWLSDRRDSPWYPTMRLFRQSRSGDWHNVFTAMSEQLRLLVDQWRR